MKALRKFDRDAQSIADLVAMFPMPSAEQMRVGEIALDEFYDGAKDADVQGACAHVYRAMRALEPFQPSLTDALLACPFCHGAVQFRKALHVSDGNVDAIIHATPTECGMPEFSDGTTDESIITKWNARAPKFSGGTCSGGE